MSTPAFVDQLYLSFFGRAADAAGRAFWSEALDAGLVTAAEVTQTFLTSQEFVAAVEPVARLYYSAFNRIPDAGGLSFWLQSARAGLPLTTVAEAFAATPEFTALYGASRNDEFIDLIYQNALGRAPDAAGKAYWVAQLATGAASRADLLAGLASSPELAASSGAAIKVIAQYHGITGTAPTQQQLDSALKAGQPLALVNQLFASSSYTGVAVPHPFVADAITTAQGGGAGEGGDWVGAPMLDLDATTPADGTTVGVSVTPTIVLAFSQDVHAGASGGMIYITDGAAQTVIDRVTGLPRTRIVGATDTRAIDVHDASHVYFDGDKVSVTVASALKPGVSYSILVGKGVLAGENDMPFGGIAHTGTLNFTPSGDITPPAVVTFALDLPVIKSGHTSTLTIQFSEAVQTIDASAFEVPNGSLAGFTSTNGGRTWTATFTPTDISVDIDSNVLTLRAGSVRDTAGNANTLAATSQNYAVDTIVQPTVDSKLDFNDTGISASDRVTNVASQVLSGKFVGAPSGTTLEVVINGDKYAVTPQEGSKTWSLSGATFAEGVNNVMAYFTNPAGKKSAERSLSFTLDTVAPTVTGGLAGAVDPGAALVLNFSEAVYWNAADEESQVVFEGGGEIVRINVGDLHFSNDHRALTIGTGDLLAPGSTYTLMLPGALTDAAGNAAASAMTFRTAGLRPAPTGLDLLDASDSGSSLTDNLTNITQPAFTGNAGTAGEYVKLYAGAAEVGSALIGANGAWQVAPLGALAEGAHTMTLKYMDLADNYSAASPVLSIAIDTTAPSAPTGLDLLAGSDSGSSEDDNITREALPYFGGGGGVEGDVVKLYANGVEVGSSQVSSGGNWQVVPSAALADGVCNMTVKFMDRAGNHSVASSALDVTIDTLAPTLLTTGSIGFISTYVRAQFSENIKFTPNGALEIKTPLGSLLQHLFHNNASWHIGPIGGGGDMAVLSVLPDVGSGSYTLEIEANTIHDLAGNAYVPLVAPITFQVH